MSICCTLIPRSADNMPGQGALRYRAGSWATFRADMLAALPEQRVPPADPAGIQPLAALTARDPSDPTIALLDATACVLDVLTFYQERHLNEAFIATAVERISLVQIARALGYEPSPGVAASGYLAFTVSALAPPVVPVPAGTAVMALPEGSAPPPIFETSASIEARASWNALPVAQRLPPADLAKGDLHIWVDGIETRARVGDGVLLYGTNREQNSGSERWEFRRLAAAVTDPRRLQTKLVFERGLGDSRTAPPAQLIAALIFRNRASVFGYNAPDWKTQSDQTQLTAWWSASGSMAHVPDTGVNGRTRLLSATPPVTEWPKFALSEADAVGQGFLDLDREYPGILPGQWVVLVDQYRTEAYSVVRARQRARVDFTLSSKVTRLKLDGEHLNRFDRRATSVWCEPDSFVRVGEPDASPITGATVVLNGAFPELEDRLLSVQGPSAIDGSACGEVVRVVAAVVSTTERTTTLTLDPPLVSEYARDEVTLNANVALATHGQTAPDEVLGSGSAAQSFQRFHLKGKPLTFISSADAPGGAAATLTVRVSGVAWARVPYLFGQDPDALVYSLRHLSDGNTLVEFGDGATGARLPPGQQNIIASYRTGIGLSGEVARGRASLLTRRPPGIDAAANPTAFSGAADPESIDEIRANAPSTALTLDRLVSLEDYADFARSFSGIGKALAVGLWTGQRRLVHLTIASASGKPLAYSDPLYTSLALALGNLQDPVHRVVIDSYVDARFSVEASLLIDPARRWEDVEAAARLALSSAFSFQTRGFGQSVTPAEVTAVLHEVPGVIAVDLDRIARVTSPFTAAPPDLQLPARGAQSSGGARQVAELLLLSTDPAHVQLGRLSQ